MKILNKLYTITAILVISCNSVEEPISGLYDKEQTMETKIHSSNPYTDIGIVYQKLLRDYHMDKNLTADQVIPLLQQTLSLNNIRIKEPDPAYISRKSTTFSTQETTLSDLIGSSSLSQPAKDSLLVFTENLSDLNGQATAIALQYIHSFESEITNNFGLNSYDKQVILTFAALVKSPPVSTLNEEEDENQNDKDWDIAIGNMIGYLMLSFSGSTETMSEAILKNLNGL